MGVSSPMAKITVWVVEKSFRHRELIILAVAQFWILIYEEDGITQSKKGDTCSRNRFINRGYLCKLDLRDFDVQC